MADAMFSLCPRGHGSGTIRLYESMKMGRACVILSDESVPNEGVDWESSSIRVPKADVAGVPDLLDGWPKASHQENGRACAAGMGKMVL
jgi:hypothetical protein